MNTVGSYEAKTHLPALLDRVVRGEQITITRHGVPVAKLVPIETFPQKDLREAFEAMKELRKGMKLDGLSVRELIEEGRR